MIRIVYICLISIQVYANELVEEVALLVDSGQLKKAENIISTQLIKKTIQSSERIQYLALLGDINFYEMEFIAAIKNYRQALKHANKTNNTYQIAEQYKNIAIAHAELSEFGESLRWHQKAWKQLEANEDINGNTALSILLAQSSIYGYIGAFEQSMETISKAQKLATKLNKLDALSDSYLRIAANQFEVKNLHAVINALKLVDTSEMNDRSSLAWYFSLYANTLIHMNLNTKSREIINQALNHNVSWTESNINNFEILLMETHIQDGNITVAKQILNELKRNLNGFEQSWVMHFLMAKLFKVEKKHKKSFETNIKAISLFFKNSSYNKFSNNSLFFNIPQNLVEATITDALDVGLSQSDLIFELFYLAFLSKEPIHVKSASPQERPIKTAIKVESAVINDILFGEASLNFTDRLKLSELQNKLAKQQGYVFYLNIQNKIYALLVSKFSISTMQLPSDSESIENLVIKLLTQLESNNLEWTTTAHKLDDFLIQPLRQIGLDELSTIHFIQDSNLRFLPMDILVDEQGVLLSDRHEIAINSVKSLKKYITGQQHSSDGSGHKTQLNLIGVSQGVLEIPSFWHTAYRNLKLAKNNLPSVNKELIQLKENIQLSHLNLGDDATESKAKEIITNATGIIHFASHGFDNPIAPAYSALVLKSDENNDGLLQAREISQLKTQADLVVLASCSSAKGGLSGLYGYSSGLAESFIHAGAKTVIGTLWDVKDKKTYQLMQWFYQGLSHELSTSEALNYAKKQARESGWKTYDWAAFILLGQTDLKLQLREKSSNFWILLTLTIAVVFMITFITIFRKN